MSEVSRRATWMGVSVKKASLVTVSELVMYDNSKSTTNRFAAYVAEFRTHSCMPLP